MLVFPRLQASYHLAITFQVEGYTINYISQTNIYYKNYINYKLLNIILIKYVHTCIIYTSINK